MMLRALCVLFAVALPAAARPPPHDLPKAADISVSGIVLTEPQTTVAVLGDDVQWKEVVLPHATFLNADRSEQLTVTVHNGDYENSISEFRVEAKRDPSAKSLGTIKHFMTGKGIYRGITEPELIAILGQPRGRDRSTLHYEIANFKDSAFLKHYNMPVYYGKYTFKGGKLDEYSFGFEYP
jgi:hypothetical protein